MNAESEMDAAQYWFLAYNYANQIKKRAPVASGNFASFAISRGKNVGRTWCLGDPLERVWELWVKPC